MAKLNIQEVLQLREQGQTLQDIANIYGCTRQYVSLFMKENGIRDYKLNLKRVTLKKIVDNIQTIERLHKEGKTYKEIEEELKVFRGSLSQYKAVYPIIAKSLPNKERLTEEQKKFNYRRYHRTYQKAHYLKKTK